MRNGSGEYKYKVSIIIVSYKKTWELFSCLSSINKYKLRTKFEIIIVDNAQDKSLQKKLAAKFPQVIYLKSSKNGGYGYGNNLGASKANGEYLLILNPDTKFIDNSLNKLVSFLDKNKDVAIVGPNLVHKNGIVFSQLGSRTLTPLRAIFALSILNMIFPNNIIAKKYHLYDTNIDRLRQVDVVPGSGLLIRKNIFNKVGGFDENFFLYFEESDLAKRIKDTNFKLKFYINPDARLMHDWRTGDPGTKLSRKIFEKSRFYYFKKHYGVFWALIVEAFCRLSKYHLIAISIIIGISVLYFFLGRLFT